MLPTLRKLSLCIAFCLCSVFTLLAQSENPLITEVRLTQGDSIFRYLYNYNENGIKTLETKWVLINDNWHKRELTEWVFENGVCTEQHLRTWKEFEWQPEHLIRFEYTDTLLTTETHLNTRSGAPENICKTVYTYKEGLLDIKTEYNWINTAWLPMSDVKFFYTENRIDSMLLHEFTNGIPASESKVEFTYNDLKQVKSILTKVKENDVWVNFSLTNYYYKSNFPFKSSEIRKIWNNKSGVWVNSQMAEYQYDISHRLTAETYQHWSGAVWINDLKHEYQYNTDGLLTKKTTYLPIFNDFRPAWSVVYSDFQYSRANLIEAKNEFWGGEKGELFNTFIPYQFNNEMLMSQGSRIEINYTEITDTATTVRNSFDARNKINVYPNPSKAIFYFNSEIYEVNRWIVTDLSGKTILEKEQKERSGVIDLASFKPGIYLLRVFTPQGIKTQKLIKEGN